MKKGIKRQAGRGCWDYLAMDMPWAECDMLVHCTEMGAPPFLPFRLATGSLWRPRTLAADQEGCGQEKQGKHSNLGWVICPRYWEMATQLQGKIYWHWTVIPPQESLDFTCKVEGWRQTQLYPLLQGTQLVAGQQAVVVRGPGRNHIPPLQFSFASACVLSYNTPLTEVYGNVVVALGLAAGSPWRSRRAGDRDRICGWHRDRPPKPDAATREPHFTKEMDNSQRILTLFYLHISPDIISSYLVSFDPPSKSKCQYAVA